MQKVSKQDQLDNNFFAKYYDYGMCIGLTNLTFAKSGYNHFENILAHSLAYRDVSKETTLFYSINPLEPGTDRRKTNVESLNWLFADLDLWHGSSEFIHIHPDHALQMIHNALQERNIPIPTVVIFSGRGFHLLWKLKYSGKKDAKSYEHKNASGRWIRINQQINELLSDFESDLKISRDYARLLRVPGSYNIKGRTNVQIIEEHPELTYSLHEIDTALNGNKITEKQYAFLDEMEKLLGKTPKYYNRREASKFIKQNYKPYMHKKLGKASKKQLAFCQDLAKKNEINLPESTEWAYEADRFIKKWNKKGQEKKNQTLFLPGDNTYTTSDDPYAPLYRNRLDVIFGVVQSDNEQTGHRESILFLARYYACMIYQDAKKALDFTLQLNQMFSEPLCKKEAVRATRSAEKYWKQWLKKGEGLKMSKRNFCSHIGIDEASYDAFVSGKTSQFETLTPEEKELRHKQMRKTWNHTSYLNRLEKEGKEYQADIRIRKERRAAIEDLLLKGYRTVPDIARTLGLSKTTVRRDILFITGKRPCEAFPEIQEKLEQERLKKEKEFKKLNENIKKASERKVNEILGLLNEETRLSIMISRDEKTSDQKNDNRDPATEKENSPPKENTERE